MLKVFFSCAVLSALAACSEQPAQSAAASPETYFDMEIGGVPFRAQLAVSDAEKMRGLMFRESLGENDAMIFVYAAPQRASFWMKNTLIPLDIGFVDAEGTLTEIKKLYPQNLDSVRSSRSDIFYCIEANAGWFAKNRVGVSSKLDISKLEKALKARGVK